MFRGSSSIARYIFDFEGSKVKVKDASENSEIVFQRSLCHMVRFAVQIFLLIFSQLYCLKVSFTRVIFS